MKKLFKLALITFSLALIAAGCSKIKTYGLVGTYKGGNVKMTVSSGGSVSFSQADISADTTTFSGAERALVKGFSSSYDYSDSLSSSSSGYGGGGSASATLTPWDLGDEKTSYTFEITEKKVSSMDTSTYTATYEDVAWKFEFTKDKDTINCKVTLTIPENVKNFNNKYQQPSSGSGTTTTLTDKSEGNRIDGGEVTFTK